MSTEPCSLLVVDSEPSSLPGLSTLAVNLCELIAARSAEEAQAILRGRAVDIVLADQKLPDMAGVELLEWVRQNAPKTVRLLMAAYAELDDALEAINRGQVYYYLLKPWRMDELVQVLGNATEKVALERGREQLLEETRRFNRELERRVQDQTHELQEANHLLQQRLREMETLALTDSLTGLLNRRAVDDVARAELRRHARYGSPVALGVVDADDFREINRRYLLTGGDEALIQLARTLTNSVRTVDTVGRIGGEEFLVVAPETGIEGATVLAERIRVNVESKPTSYKEAMIPLTVSIGFAVAEQDVPAEYEQMKHVAAGALSEAKAGGRNQSVVRDIGSGGT